MRSSTTLSSISTLTIILFLQIETTSSGMMPGMGGMGGGGGGGGVR